MCVFLNKVVVVGVGCGWNGFGNFSLGGIGNVVGDGDDYVF